MDYFSLFGLKVRYDIASSLLTSRFQDLQRQFHPDRFACHSQQERIISLHRAATINKAYQTIKNPLKRAEYMLFLYGFDLTNDKHILHDTVFLLEQLELREKLSLIEKKANAKGALAEFSIELNDSIKHRNVLMVQQLNDKKWPEASDTVRKLRFLDKLKQQVEEITEKLLSFE